MNAALGAVFIGDSLTLGVGDPAGLGWVGRVALSSRRRGIELTAYNLGIRRDTSSDIARRWKAEALVRLPATSGLTVFSFGTNDCLDEAEQRRVAHDRTLRNAELILRSARSLGPALMVGPPPTAQPSENVWLGALSADLRALCKALRVSFIELFSPLHQADWIAELAASDGYHPGSTGYERIARLIEKSPAWVASLEGALKDAGKRESVPLAERRLPPTQFPTVLSTL